MNRSLWKGPFVKSSLLGFVVEKVWSRSSVILPHFVGKTVKIYNGNGFLPVVIKPAMVGYKFGFFALTKRIGRNIHLRKRKKNLKKGQKKK